MQTDAETVLRGVSAANLDERPEGVVKGYHCWAEFWDGKGWVPVDASDASKNPKLAEYLFGNLDPERCSSPSAAT